MAYLGVMLASGEIMSAEEETPQKSLVRNTPAEELALELESAAKKTKERILQEDNEARQKERERCEKIRESQYQSALKHLSHIWFGIGGKEFDILPDKTRHQLEEVVFEKSRKSFWRWISALSLWDISLFTIPFLISGNPMTLFFGAALAIIFGIMPWCIIENTSTIYLYDAKNRKQALIQGGTE